MAAITVAWDKYAHRDGRVTSAEKCISIFNHATEALLTVVELGDVIWVKQS